MKKLYGLFFSYREVNLFIAYSNKKKKIMRYLCNTLHINEDDMELFSVQEIPEDWVHNISDYESTFLIEEIGIIMTSIEWEIIHNGYKVFIEEQCPHFNELVNPFIYALDEDGINHWNEIMKRINSYSDREFEDRLYSGFIHFHALMNNDGTIQAFINRLEMINSFREGKLLDDECDMYSDLYYT